MEESRNNYVRAEFHCHTVYSPDSLVKVRDLLDACAVKGVTKLAITDHGAMGGAFEAKALAPEQIVLAEEIQTTEGELLAYFMTEPIPQYLPVMEVIERLKRKARISASRILMTPIVAATGKMKRLSHRPLVMVWKCSTRVVSGKALIKAYALQKQ